MTGEFERGFSDGEQPDWDQEAAYRPEESGAQEGFPADEDAADWGEDDGEWEDAAHDGADPSEHEESAASPSKPPQQQPEWSPPPRQIPAGPRGRLGWDGLPKGRKLIKPDEVRLPFSPQERLLLLDTWQRSGLPAGDFAPLVGLSKHTLYLWKKRFAEHGPAGLTDQPRGASKGSKLTEVTKRTIVMLKEAHPEWGCQRISDELVRGPALSASAAALARVLHEAGYQLEERVTRPHPDKVRSFERAKPNQLWQTDLFTFVLKRQNRRLHLVGFMDDHSRFIVGFGLHATASTALVLEVLRGAIASYGPPEEILTDNGPQYVTWRGKSQFSRELTQQGIRQVIARPKHPQTLGKIERFWGTMWRECLERSVFMDLEEARQRIGHFIDHYNFQRPHQGLEGLAPADRFFSAAPAVLKTLKERVAANALELARHGELRPPFYVTGQVAGQSFSVHAEGERVILTRPGQPRQEVELVGPPTAEAAEPAALPGEQRSAQSICPHAAPPDSYQQPERAPGVSWYETSPLAGAEQSTPVAAAEPDPTEGGAV